MASSDMTDNINVINSLLSMFNNSLRSLGDSSRGTAQVSALSQYNRGSSSSSIADKVRDTSMDTNLGSISRLAELKKASVNEVEEGRNISARFTEEKKAAAEALQTQMKPTFDKIYQFPEEAQARFEELANSKNVNERIFNAIDRASFSNNLLLKGSKDKRKSEVKRSLFEIRERLEAEGIDVSKGGRRIFAREALKVAPEAFGSLNPKGRFNILADKTPAERAIGNFNVSDKKVIKLEEDLAIATCKEEVSVSKFNSISKNAKSIADSHDLAKIAVIEKSLADKVKGGDGINLAETLAPSDRKEDKKEDEVEAVKEETDLETAVEPELAEGDDIAPEVAAEVEAEAAIEELSSSDGLETVKENIADPEIPNDHILKQLDHEAEAYDKNETKKTFVVIETPDGEQKMVPKHMQESYKEVYAAQANAPEPEEVLTPREELDILIKEEKEAKSGTFVNANTPEEPVMVRRESVGKFKDLQQKVEAEELEQESSMER